MFEGHHTVSSTHKYLVVKTYVFLLFSVLLLPSLFLTSLDALIRKGSPRHSPTHPLAPYPYTLQNAKAFRHAHTALNTRTGWDNRQHLNVLFSGLFLPNSAAFFINYIIQMAIVGQIVEVPFGHSRTHARTHSMPARNFLTVRCLSFVVSCAFSPTR
jgi:hypothetical protein